MGIRIAAALAQSVQLGRPWHARYQTRLTSPTSSSALANKESRARRQEFCFYHVPWRLSWGREKVQISQCLSNKRAIICGNNSAGASPGRLLPDHLQLTAPNRWGEGACTTRKLTSSATAQASFVHRRQHSCAIIRRFKCAGCTGG